MRALVRAALAAFLLAIGGAPAALAQSGGEERGVFQPDPDANGVDLVTGGFSVAEPSPVIPASSRLQLNLSHHEGGSISSNLRNSVAAQVDLTGIWHDEMTTIPEWPRIYALTVDGRSTKFLCYYADAGSCEQMWPKDGSFLEFVNGGLTSIVLVTSDGTRVTFPALPGETDTQNVDKGLSYADNIVYPNGEKISFQMAYTPNDGQGIRTTATSNLGYSIFVSDVTRTKYKGGTAISTTSAAKADVTDSMNYTRVMTDDLGRQTKVHLHYPWGTCAPQVVTWAEDQSGLRTDYELWKNGAGTAFIRSQYGRVPVKYLTRNGKTWSYSNADDQRTVTSPDSSVRTVVTEAHEYAGGDGYCNAGSAIVGFITSSTSGTGRTTTYQFADWQQPSPRKLGGVTNPEGDKFTYLYDIRGNLTSTTQVGKAGTASRVIYQASFPSTCTNPKTCNQPTWTKDAAQAQTDYTYDSTHGGLVTKIEPAAANGFRRKTWNEYASYDTGNGTIWRVSATHLCSVYANGTNYDCGTATDMVTRFTYWEKTFLPLTITQTTGTDSVSAVLTFTYDAAGRRLSETDPTNITRYFRYDAVGRRTWEIEPNASGSFAAKRTTYDNGDRVTRIDVGTIPNSTSTSLTIASSLTHVYDAEGNRTKSAFLDASGNKLSQRQTAYDNMNRPTCSVRRMNPAAFDATSDACTLGTAGSQGPDRITKTTHDLDGRLTKTIVGFGVLNGGAGETAMETAYTQNGQVQWREDGKGNRTNYAYDDYDRAWRTTFPDSSQEFLEYDSAGRLWKSTKRDSKYVTHSYDGAGLLTSTAFSNGETTVSRTYDAKMRPASVTQGSNTLTFAYDALGRSESTQSNSKQLAFQYDPAGRRTRITYPDSVYVTYEYNAAGKVSAVRESGSTLLASVTYDTLNRRTALTNANGTSTSYGYDAAARLVSQGQDLASTSSDLSLGFAYNAASQVSSASRSNDNYAWTGHVNVNRGYASNTLNQYTSAGGVSFTYDGRGNLTQSGSSSYTYSVDNRLLTGPGATLTYDPDGRLLRVQGGSSTRFLHDGGALAAEYDDSGTILRRYVQAPGTEEVLVWYEGSGTSDKRWLHADAKGSIIAASNSSGASILTNRYDEYGIPGSGNAGRFQFTGQVWLDELGMYYFKARIYSPTLGRFMQTDPVGYKDGMNLYAYVGNDPVNFADPTGTCAIDQKGNVVRCQITFAAGVSAADQQTYLKAFARYGAAIERNGSKESRTLWANTTQITVGPSAAKEGGTAVIGRAEFSTTKRELNAGDAGRDGRLYFSTEFLTDKNGKVDQGELAETFFHELHHGSNRSMRAKGVGDRESLTDAAGITEGINVGIIPPGTDARFYNREGTNFVEMPPSAVPTAVRARPYIEYIAGRLHIP